MLTLIKNILGIKTPINHYELIKNGAIIIDVRSKSEFDQGHIKGSLNFPFMELGHSAYSINNLGKPLIVCCSNGDRSSYAILILKSHGFNEVYNGGNWVDLKKIISKN